MKNASELEETPEGVPKDIQKAYEILKKHGWTRRKFISYVAAHIPLWRMRINIKEELRRKAEKAKKKAEKKAEKKAKKKAEKKANMNSCSS
jgi:hypothetical protein